MKNKAHTASVLVVKTEDPTLDVSGSTVVSEHMVTSS